MYFLVKNLAFLFPFVLYLLVPPPATKAKTWVFSSFVSQEMGDQGKANVTIKGNCKAKEVVFLFVCFKPQILCKDAILIKNPVLKFHIPLMISVRLGGFIK